MFIIKPKFAEDWQVAIFMLSYYHVSMTTFSDGDNVESAYMVVSCGKDQSQEDLRLAEMCFQMNWNQVGRICPHCAEVCTDEEFCGHLTFDMPIEKLSYVS